MSALKGGIVKRTEKTYKPFLVTPTLARRCEVCGKWFDLCHPKDPQRYCEKCREEKHELQPTDKS